MPSNARTLLFIHGIRNDDPSAEWRDALDTALRREGTPTLAQRGYRIVGPSYRDELEARSCPATAEPQVTYRKASDPEYVRAAGKYWALLADLQRCGLRDVNVDRGPLGDIPTPGAAAKAMLRQRFKDAEAYRSSADRRHAIFQRLLRELPSSGDLVIVAHSLGSVVAADLIYYLPERLRLRMLVTLGSPLALTPLREHLNRRRNRFPFEIIGPWINVAGTGDLVTGFRGISPHFPEALDIFVDTGWQPRPAHASRSYLEQTVVARALEWLDGTLATSPPDRDGNGVRDLAFDGPVLSVAVGAQYALRLEQQQPAGETRRRFAQARELAMRGVPAGLGDAGHHHPIADRLMLDNSALLKGRATPDATVGLLLSAWMLNPINPYEIKLSDDQRHNALERLAGDLGVPAEWARTVVESERSARSTHGPKWSLGRAAMLVAGAAAIVAAPMLVLVAAPAGLAGGAAIVAGLTALGPGGMIGGLGIVGLLGSAGGAVTARALISGSAAQVEETVIHLQALAVAQRDLRVAPPSYPEWFALVSMEDAIAEDLSRLRRFSDEGAPGIKELERKLHAVERALHWFEEHGLRPPGPPGSDEAEPAESVRRHRVRTRHDSHASATRRRRVAD
jgi:hypothetical protein